MNKYGKILNKVLLVAGVSAFFVSCGGSDSKIEDPVKLNLVADITNKVIRPVYVSLSSTSTAFVAQVDTFCDSPTNQSLDDIRGAWRGLMSEWQFASVIRMDPLENNDLGLRIESWPLGENILESRVDVLLNAEETINESVIRNGSITIQGIPALEYLLFGGENEVSVADFESGKRCEVITAITGVLDDNIQTANEQWQGSYGDDVAQPEKAEGGYESSRLALDDIANNLNTAFESILNDKLGFVLGGEFGDQSSEMLESYRSGYSLENIQQNILAVKDLFHVENGLGISLYLTYQGSKELGERINTELDSLLLQISEVETPISESINTPENYERLSLILQSVLNLHNTFEEELFPALAVTVDFNSQDGD